MEAIISDEDEVVTSERAIIPDGFLCEFRIKEIKLAESKEDINKNFLSIVVVPTLPLYSDVLIREHPFLAIKGYEERQIKARQTMVKYILQHNQQRPDPINIERYSQLQNMKFVGQVGVFLDEWFDKQTREKRYLIKNRINHILSLREGANGYEKYQSWKRGEQMYLTGNMPELPNKKSNNYVKPTNVPLDDDVPF